MSRNLQDLAQTAVVCLIDQKPMPVAHQAGEERDGFPLPIKRVKETMEDGSYVQMYRPLAILEYVDDVLSGKIASLQAKARNKQKKETP